jgi:hypothetical protein
MAGSNDFSRTGKLTIDVIEKQLAEIKGNYAEMPGFLLDLVAFECEFSDIIKVAHEAGYYSMNESKLYELVKENMESIRQRRSDFVETRLKLLVESSTEVIPNLEKLYKDALESFQSLKDTGDHREAIGYLSNLTRILDSLAKLQLQLESTEKNININVLGHADINFRILKNFENQGALKIMDESLLKTQLGMNQKPAAFIEQFKEV